MMPGQVFASSDKVKTAKPSQEFTSFTIFDSNFKFLDDGSGNISYLGKQKVSIWGQTLGTRKLDTIGVQLTLQRWTGTEWIDVYTGSNNTLSNSSYVYTSIVVAVSEGYYYRVKSKHWIDYDNTNENGIRYSSYILID